MIRGAQCGSSLVEVLVALFLTSVALLAAAPMFVLAMKQDAAGADLGRVGARGNARMELLRALPYYQLVPGGSLTTDTAGYVDTSDPEVVVRWEIIDGGGPTAPKTIAVHAEATRQTIGAAKQVELRTLRVR